MKRILSLLLIALCVVSITGCKGAVSSATPLTAQEKITKAAEQMTKVKSMDADMTMAVELSGSGFSLNNTTTAAMSFFTGPVRFKCDLKTQMMGTDQAMQVFVITEGTALVMYMNTGNGWYKQTLTSDLANATVSQNNMQANPLLFLTGVSDATEDGTEEIGGKKLTRIKGVFTGAALENAVKSTQMSDVMKGTDAAGYAQLFKDLPNVGVTLWIETESMVLVKFDIDMTAFTNQIYKNMSTINSGTTMLSGLTVNKMTMQMTYKNANAATDFMLPAETVNAADMAAKNK